MDRCEHCGLKGSEEDPVYRFHEVKDGTSPLKEILPMGESYKLHENCKKIFSESLNKQLVGYFNPIHAELLTRHWV